MTHESDLQLRALGLYPMQHLPNRAGFQFVGRMRDGKEIGCIIIKDFLTGLHRVSFGQEEYTYADLIGWRHA